VRLVRLAQQPSLVAEDIRAALAALGRGNTVVGGIALIGVRPFPDEPSVDAVVVLPRGILTVVGVDLPDPAMRLEAPLQGQWKADGWPLLHADDVINPASKALVVSEKVAKKLTEAHPSAGVVGTVIAVGPFVDSVDQPPADLAGTVRVFHPTPTSMLAATVSLATSNRPRSVGEARALLRTLAPDAPEQSEEVLLGEGFSATVDATYGGPTVVHGNPPLAVTPAVPAEHPVRRANRPAAPPKAPVATATATATATAPPPPLLSATATAKQPEPGNRLASVRWLPLAAIGLLAVLMIAAILVATNRGSEQKPPRAAAAPTSATASPVPGTSTPQPVEAIQFTATASGADQRCASHGFGAVQGSLQRTSCAAVRRGSFAATIDGREAAVTVAIVEFANAAQATGFKTIADTPGGGGILDIATETSKSPASVPVFEGAAYCSAFAGSSVRLVQAVWLSGPSTPDDPGLIRAAKSALDLPISS
jgi:hypothetical protein